MILNMAMIELIGAHVVSNELKRQYIFFKSSYISFVLLHLFRFMSNVQQIDRQASCFALNSITALLASLLQLRRREKQENHQVHKSVGLCAVFSEH